MLHMLQVSRPAVHVSQLFHVPQRVPLAHSSTMNLVNDTGADRVNMKGYMWELDGLASPQLSLL